MKWYLSTQGKIALVSIVSIVLFLLLRVLGFASGIYNFPLFATFVLGSPLLILSLLKKALAREFSSDLLAGVSIIASLSLGEYLAGTLVILMMSGGEALENYALKRASSVLDALSKRIPNMARRKKDGAIQQVSLNEIEVGDLLELLPHDICPVDGEVAEGRGSMDEAYLTGEPYQMPKIPGSGVISGAINSESVLIIKAISRPIDSRYQKIAQVIESQASKQVPMRRIADRLGAWYTPIVMFIAFLTWVFTGEARRFLSVIIVATPCPLIIAIPVAIIGAISSAAKKGIIIKNPAALENTSLCKTIILDKTGTLTYGTPAVTEIELSPGFEESEIAPPLAALETYSKHPLAEAILNFAKTKGLTLPEVTSVSEQPGQGLKGWANGKQFTVVGRGQVTRLNLVPLAQKDGLECHVLVDGKYAAVVRFRDTPRKESRAFVDHLGTQHGIKKVMILSGDREREVRHLAEIVGIADSEGGLSPEEKLVRVIKETRLAPTIYVGDGINDAPALQASTVGIAMGTKSDITSEAADAVILEQSLIKVDEFVHLSTRMRRIALQSALGGMGFSIIGVVAAAFGYLPPLAGAIIQEVIDVLAVLNALRTSSSPGPSHHEL